MSLSEHSVGTCLETSSHNLLGNIQPQSSQLAEALWSDPGIKSGISVHELISASKKKEKKKSADREQLVERSPKILASEERATTTTKIHIFSCASERKQKKGELQPTLSFSWKTMKSVMVWGDWETFCSTAAV